MVTLDRAREKVISVPYGMGLRGRAVHYVIPQVGWAVDWVGLYVSRGASAEAGWRAVRTTKRFQYLRRQVVHFGNLGNYIGGFEQCHPSNQVIATVFHGDDQSGDAGQRAGVTALKKLLDRPDRVVTSASIMANRLRNWGVEDARLRLIPLGVDLLTFGKFSADKRRLLRQSKGIPEDSVCIGSFQKDGTGWGDGLEPKWIKGPDAFVEVVRRLARDFPVFVLLTGPARGYVIGELEKHGVPYLHEFPDDFALLADFYNCLDIYLVTSRDEGGPQSVVESQATGVPLVSTRVGMAPDVVEHGVNGYLADVDDLDALTELAADLIQRPDLRTEFADAGSERVKHYDWDTIGSRYWTELYAPLLGGEGMQPATDGLTGSPN